MARQFGVAAVGAGAAVMSISISTGIIISIATPTGISIGTRQTTARGARVIGSTTPVTARASITVTPVWLKNMVPVRGPTGSHVTRPVAVHQQALATGPRVRSQGIGACRPPKPAHRLRIVPEAVIQARAAHLHQIAAAAAVHLLQTAIEAPVVQPIVVHAVRRQTGSPVTAAHQAGVPVRMGVREVERVVAADGGDRPRRM